jgi:glycosyltransferase involved in cell wall biosynthesis
MTLAPLVSAIIPVRNGRDYIDEALQSVLTQNCPNLEIIVVDDGSDDYDYMKLKDVDKRIEVIRLAGYGVSRARNTGMRHAKGKYIAFLDADDVWFPGKLEAQIRYFDNHPNVGCVFGGFLKWYRDESSGVFPQAHTLWNDCGEITGNAPERSGWIYTKLLSGLLVGMNTAVIRREVFDLLGGFDESMRIGEDYMFWLKTSRVFEMHALDGPVALYRIHSSSAMNRLSEENHQARLLRTAFERWGLVNPDGSKLPLESFRRRLALTEFTHGYKHYWHGNPGVAARAFRGAIAGMALPIRSTAYYLLSQWKRLLALFYKRQ